MRADIARSFLACERPPVCRGRPAAPRAQVVPDAWSVINDQDVVAKAPKFLVLYKRGGQRIIINAAGDMLVRPSFIEVTVRNGGARQF